jgi:hypothetical protein
VKDGPVCGARAGGCEFRVASSGQVANLSHPDLEQQKTVPEMAKAHSGIIYGATTVGNLQVTLQSTALTCHGFLAFHEELVLVKFWDVHV